MKLKKPSASSPQALFLLTIFLTIIGILFVFEASVAQSFAIFGHQFHFVRQQIIWAVIGVVAMFGMMWVPTQWWNKAAPLLYVLGIVMLIAVFIPSLGKEVNGAKRWIDLGVLSFQPVEFVKFGLVTFFASWMTKHQKLGPFLFLTLIPAALLFAQPDMGSALIVLAIGFSLYYLAGAPYKVFLAISGVGVVALALLILVSPYRMKRLATFLDPESDPLGASFHIRQITLALGNGGWWGQGIGQSRQKFSYLPEASTDSIFAIIAEEVGFFGSAFLFLLFALFFRFSYKIVKQTEPGSFEHLLAAGIVIWLGTQILLNLSAIVALVPLTGVPLPFFSYGGTSLVMILSVTGILIGIGKRTKPT